MTTYSTIIDDIYSVFSSNSWKLEGIKTFPSNFSVPEGVMEYIRVSIIPSGPGINLKSKSGIVIVDIFTAAGLGESRYTAIADKLDDYLVGKSFSTVAGNVTQFSNSSLVYSGLDPDNNLLSRASYSIPFSHFGVE